MHRENYSPLCHASTTSANGYSTTTQVKTKKKKKKATNFFLCFRSFDVVGSEPGRPSRNVFTYVAVGEREGGVFPKVVPVSSLATSDNEGDDEKCRSTQNEKKTRCGFYQVLKAVLFKTKLVNKIKERKSEKNFANTTHESSITSTPNRHRSEDVPKVISKKNSYVGVEEKRGVVLPKVSPMASPLLGNEENEEKRDSQYWRSKGRRKLSRVLKAILFETSLAAMKENTGTSMRPAFEIVRCKLTVFYEYWQMNEILEALLPEGMIVPSAFETVGHIAHLNLRDEHLPYKKLIAKVILDKNKPKIQTVVNKIDAIHNDYRTMQLEVLAGNRSLVTTVVENGLRFHVDLATVYWNSRLATERQRLVNSFTRKDVVCDVFTGVGPIAMSAARIVKRVYANDLNPNAIEYLERNSVINKLERKIKVFNMDGRRFIGAMFASDKAKSITQVVMNLPNDAAEYLDAFRGILVDRPTEEEFTLPMIHVYGFSKAQDPEFDFHQRIRIALSEAAVDVEMRRVRLVAPGKWMLCASFNLPKSVAYAKPTLDM